MLSQKEAGALIEECLRHHTEVFRYPWHPYLPMDRLLASPEDVISVMLFARFQWPPGIHSRDACEVLVVILRELGKRHIETFLQLEEELTRTMPNHLWMVRYALAESKDPRVIPYFLEALQDRDRAIREHAAEVLVHRRSKHVRKPLIAALNDRSSLVKWAIVKAMFKRPALRTQEALIALGKIARNKLNLRKYPGLVQTAQRLIDVIQSEMSRP